MTEPTTDERLDSLERFQVDIERRFAEAFPGGDQVGHCRYHALMIESLEERKRLRRALTEKAVTGVVLSVVATIGIALWEWFQRKMGVK